MTNLLAYYELILDIDIIHSNKLINSLDTSSLDSRVAPATLTRGEGGRRPPSPLVHIKLQK